MKIVWHEELYTDGIFKNLNTIFALQIKKYEFGTIDGIYVDTEDGKDIIAIYNSQPHNGHFDLFLKALEDHIKETGERITLCDFLNENLYWHLRKKCGYGNIGSTMDRLEITVRKENESVRPICRKKTNSRCIEKGS